MIYLNRTHSTLTAGQSTYPFNEFRIDVRGFRVPSDALKYDRCSRSLRNRIRFLLPTIGQPREYMPKHDGKIDKNLI